MKKKILFITLIVSCFFTPAYALLVGKEKLENVDIRNAVLLLEGAKDVEKNPTKGIEILKSYEDKNSTKLILSYCYENALGCEKDEAKAQEYLSSIRNTEVVEETIWLFATSPDTLSFALKFADFSYAKYGNSKNAYTPFMKNFYFKRDNPHRYAEILALLEENLEQNANLLFDAYIYIGNYDKLLSLTDHVDFVELNKGRSFRDSFARIIRNGDVEVLEKFLKSASFFIEELEAESASVNGFYLSFCKMYGYGCEKDEKSALELYKNYASLPINRIAEYDVTQLALSPFAEAGDFVFRLAKDVEKRGDNSLYIYCLRRGFGTQKDLAQGIELSYENLLLNFKHRISYTIIPDFLILYQEGKSTKRLEEIAYDTISKELDNKVISNVDVFYNLHLLGYGQESDKAKIFSIKKDYAEKIKEPILIESLAYFYDNGIGCEKDPQKAKELRLEIDKFIKERYSDDIAMGYFVLYLGIYTSDKNNLRAIYAPEIIEYYKNKMKPYKKP